MNYVANNSNIDLNVRLSSNCRLSVNWVPRSTLYAVCMWEEVYVTRKIVVILFLSLSTFRHDYRLYRIYTPTRWCSKEQVQALRLTKQGDTAAYDYGYWVIVWLGKWNVNCSEREERIVREGWDAIGIGYCNIRR